MLKAILRRLIPSDAILQYHRALAWLAAARFGFPAKEIIVIGVTGTKGKTSAMNFIWSVLMEGGIKTGMISTANIRVGEEEIMNPFHMTMPGRATIQGYLRRMAKSGCRVALIETTSEGLKQYRHTGVYYDIGVFTNLTPEHLRSHEDSFEKYKEMKGRMFAALSAHKKVINGQGVEKVIIANGDSEHADFFLRFPADKKLTFGTIDGVDYRAENIVEENDGVIFSVEGERYKLGILGAFNVWNALPAIAIGEHFGLDAAVIANGLNALKLIPGRMEVIDGKQDFKVIVDYAHEKVSMGKVLAAGRGLAGPNHQIIVLLGAEGGGRDKVKRPEMGELAGRLADHVVVSNVDPYEDDPQEILQDIAVAAEKQGKVRGTNLHVIEDRRAGISAALKLAEPGDVVLITGKGAEQSIVIGGVSAPWDDRTVVKEELAKLN